MDDLPLIKLIVATLGYGTIHSVTKENTVHLSINTKTGIIDIIELTNGFYCTPKHESFVNLINWYRNLSPEYTVVAKPIDISPLYSNAWLAGFAEGDGSFDIRTNESPRRVETVFELVQSRIDLELVAKYISIMENVATFMLSKLDTYQVTNPSGTISKRLQTRNTSRAGAGIMAQYFTLFPIFSSKRNNFESWRSVYVRILLRKTKSDEDFLAVNAIKIHIIADELNLIGII